MQSIFYLSYTISFKIEWNMIVVTVIPSIINQTEFDLIHNNRKENCHYDKISLNLKGIRSILLRL